MKTLNLSLILPFVLAVIIFPACSKNVESPASTLESPNILLIIADDLGKDALSGFSEGLLKPATPNLDAIRTSGLTFSNLWVNPTCTPTRAAIMTGKYGYRTQVKGAGDILAGSEITLQQYLRDQTNGEYASALIGKWHLSGNDPTVNPESFGIDYYAGLIRGAVDNYYRWQLSESGATSLQTTYITEKLTDLSIDWVNQQNQPWFLWLAYNAPHTPFHVPPAQTHTQGNLPEFTTGMDPLPYYLAAIESMDYQIGRLLNNIPDAEKDNLIVIFVGDNGTPNQVAQSPYSSATVKNTLYQGGVNTPMFISGTGVLRTGVDDNLITGTDLFATIAEIAGINTPEVYDSKSFKSLFAQTATIRDYQYTEMDDGSGDQWAIRNETYKLIMNDNGNSELYNLRKDPYEQEDLLKTTLSTTVSGAKAALEAELRNIRQ
ncbi:sulfatase-like hydrolase/transferase [Flavilitoribacter nigricans]|uniref:Sulfatase n=1 Tax=Flavilitoribacter nigricans (strain ATCC 23147 / DSM 23189 / NBRC 102662 / NCIMB 1420 / SS-2) TaxID=1122177 RepID=A0A2D0NAS4_FLAN2|nr:sulfatase-like hydrolase/transferase [Flavilitoribacter nigricans]PHN05269.1 sulfatase [Flavilitoribacter nigricans DSM 23189 = NBRC 102662]